MPTPSTTTALNEPLYQGVPLGDLLDTPVYANGPTQGYSTDKTTVLWQFKNGGLIGTLYSWIVDTDGTVYMLFYKTQEDYANFSNPFLVPLSNNGVVMPALPGIKSAIDQAAQDAANSNKSTLQIYIEKYMPWVIGVFGVAMLLPSVRGLFTKKMGATGDQKNGGLLLLLFFGGVAVAMKKGTAPALTTTAKKPSTVSVGPAVDVTDWSMINPQTGNYYTAAELALKSITNPALTAQPANTTIPIVSQYMPSDLIQPANAPTLFTPSGGTTPDYAVFTPTTPTDGNASRNPGADTYTAPTAFDPSNVYTDSLFAPTASTMNGNRNLKLHPSLY